jgi:rubredoxin
MCSLMPAAYSSGVPDRRYRCTACGNLTRFDVTLTRRSRRFHHYTVGGELTVEDEQVLSELVEDVSCRWCGSGKAVELLAEDEEA